MADRIAGYRANASGSLPRKMTPITSGHGRLHRDERDRRIYRGSSSRTLRRSQRVERDSLRRVSRDAIPHRVEDSEVVACRGGSTVTGRLVEARGPRGGATHSSSSAGAVGWAKAGVSPKPASAPPTHANAARTVPLTLDSLSQGIAAWRSSL